MTAEELKGIIEGVTAGFDAKFEKISASIDQKIKESIDGVAHDIEEIKAGAVKSKEDMEAIAVNLAEAKEKIEASAVKPEPVKAAAEPPKPTVISAGQSVVKDTANEPKKSKADLIKAAKVNLKAGKIDMKEYTHAVVRINAGIEE